MFCVADSGGPPTGDPVKMEFRAAKQPTLANSCTMPPVHTFHATIGSFEPFSAVVLYIRTSSIQYPNYVSSAADLHEIFSQAFGTYAFRLQEGSELSIWVPRFGADEDFIDDVMFRLMDEYELHEMGFGIPDEWSIHVMLRERPNRNPLDHVWESKSEYDDDDNESTSVADAKEDRFFQVGLDSDDEDDEPLIDDSSSTDEEMHDSDDDEPPTDDDEPPTDEDAENQVIDVDWD